MRITSHHSYEEQQFEGLAATSKNYEQSEFLNCRFRNCQFSESVFKACSFHSCLFEACGLEMLRIEKSVFKDTRFVKSKMLGIDWSAAAWGRREIAQALKTIDFQGCALNYSSFLGLNLEGIRFLDCVLHEVDFSEALLRRADFSGSDLQRAIFRNTDLREANFSQARNYSISPQLNNISKAHFSLPEAMGLLYAMDIQLDE